MHNELQGGRLAKRDSVIVGKGGRVALTVEGKSYDALIKEIDYNTLKREVNEIDFKALPAALVEKIELDVGDLIVASDETDNTEAQE